MLPSFCFKALTFWHHKMSQAHRVLALSSDGRSHFTFGWTMVSRNQDLGTRCSYCYWSIIASSFFQGKELEIYVSICILLYLFVHLSFCKCNKNHCLIVIPPIPIDYHKVYSKLTLYLWLLSQTMIKLALIAVSIITYSHWSILDFTENEFPYPRKYICVWLILSVVLVYIVKILFFKVTEVS